MAPARTLSKATRRRLNREKIWKQDVLTEDETDILAEWFRALRRQGYVVGRWRQVHTVTTDPLTRKPWALIKDIRKTDKVPGLLVKVHHKWALYFHKDINVSIHVFMAAMDGHPIGGRWHLGTGAAQVGAGVQ